MTLEIVNPEDWKTPVGYSCGVVASGSRWLFLGGQVAFDAGSQIVSAGDLLGQFRQTIENLQTVCESAGATLQDIAKLTVFVQDRDDYRDKSQEIGQIYREYFGTHYPAMTLVEVARFYETDVLVEIEGIAVLP